jgi:drug/metabolite transporter (DMT)-like permease
MVSIRLFEVRRKLQRLPRATWILGALRVAWLAQGSTFVAVKIGVAAVPPLLFSGARFLVAGALLLTWVAWRAGWRLKIDRHEAFLGALTGTGLILAGQSAASWSSQYLAPGIVAVLTATIPLWAALTAWLAFHTRMSLLGSLGLVAGFAGVGFLAWPGAGSGIAFGPAIFVVAGSAVWGMVVVIASRSGHMRRPVVITSLQMLVGGGLQMVVAMATGEFAQVVPDHLVAAIPVFIFIVAVPSLVGYTLFTWLLSEAPVHIANTGSYVGPVIALGLGWIILGERVSLRTVAGVTVILLGVALIVWSNRQPRPAAAKEPEPAAELEALAA